MRQEKEIKDIRTGKEVILKDIVRIEGNRVSESCDIVFGTQTHVFSKY